MDNTSHDHDQLGWARDWLKSEHDTVQVPVASLRPGDSPRLKGESKAHIASMVDAAAEMPPIIVHQPTSQVIDGIHRLRAATQRGQDTIAAFLFNGTAEAAFVLSVAANITHGWSLNPKERRAAAIRILGMYPDWSDRTVAANAGLSPRTVATIRRKCSGGQIAHLNRRRGRDGKTYPARSNAARQAAIGFIRANPSKSVREVARQAGVSVGTVHDARSRLRQSGNPSVSKTRGAGLDCSVARGQTALERLRTDPSVRSHEDGKVLLRLSSESLRFASVVTALSRRLPQHCWYAVAELAAALSDTWSRVAQELRALIQAG